MDVCNGKRRMERTTADEAVVSAKGAASPAATWPGPTTVLGTPYPIITSLFEKPTETLKKEIL